MKSVICISLCLLALLAVSSAQGVFSNAKVGVDDLVAYNKWRNSHGRTYTSEDERLFRQLVFLENKQQIDEHNKSNPTFTQGLNQFSDLTEEEFNYRVLNAKIPSKLSNTKGRRLQQTNNTGPIPASVDWRTTGAILPVKDQGRCGSCWTFSISGIVEPHYFLKHNQHASFSEQQILDCVSTSHGYESDGCNGGWPEEALQYVIEYGAVKSSVYPYVVVQGKCRNIPYDVPRYYPEGWYYRVNDNSDDLKRAIAQGPVSVCVNATPWRFYKNGVLSGHENTIEDELNHAIVAVGYDADGNWILRNSWSTAWGEEGYIRLAPGNTCGVLLYNLAFDN